MSRWRTCALSLQHDEELAQKHRIGGRQLGGEAPLQHRVDRGVEAIRQDGVE